MSRIPRPHLPRFRSAGPTPGYASPLALALLSCALLLMPGEAMAESPSAQEIMDRALDTESIGFRSGEISMTLIIQDRSGDSRERRLAIRGLREDDRSRALVRVTGPAEIAGQSYLFRENPGGDDDVYVYLPAVDESPRRIAGSQRNSSFMGTHFTFADLQSRDLRDATYERRADETIGRFEVYVIDAFPTASTESDYARVRAWIRKDDDIPLRVRFFDADDNERRTLFTEELGDHDGRTYVRRMTLRPAEGGATTMIINEIDMDAEIGRAEFSPQNLVQ